MLPAAAPVIGTRYLGRLPELAKKGAEIEQLRALMKAGTLSETVAVAVIEKAEQERDALERAQPEQDEKRAARVIRMLPQAARVLRQRISRGNLGFLNPRSIVQARNVCFQCSADGWQCGRRR
jgi:hypothetical protein